MHPVIGQKLIELFPEVSNLIHLRWVYRLVIEVPQDREGFQPCLTARNKLAWRLALALVVPLALVP